jgi:hypothetical protein
MKHHQIHVQMDRLPLVVAEHRAVHKLLLERLEVGWGTRDCISIETWNELIAAHDALIEASLTSDYFGAEP